MGKDEKEPAWIGKYKLPAVGYCRGCKYWNVGIKCCDYAVINKKCRTGKTRADGSKYADPGENINCKYKTKGKHNRAALVSPWEGQW